MRSTDYAARISIKKSAQPRYLGERNTSAMLRRAKLTAAIAALLGLATVTLLSPKALVQAQTQNLSVAGAVYSGTSAVNTTPGPVPPCYTSTGAACNGKYHAVSDHTSQSLFANCSSNQTCDFTLNNVYITIALSGAAAFSSTHYTCSATIWTSSAGYVGYCQPATGSAINIYMYNPTSSTVTSGTTVTINYSASGD
jgi:hypothetical protein